MCPSLWFLALHSHFLPVTNILTPAFTWLIFSPAVLVFAEYTLLCIHFTTSTPHSIGNNHICYKKMLLTPCIQSKRNEMSVIWMVNRQWFHSKSEWTLLGKGDIAPHRKAYKNRQHLAWRSCGSLCLLHSLWDYNYQQQINKLAQLTLAQNGEESGR